jgi:hypothetical protein
MKHFVFLLGTILFSSVGYSQSKSTDFSKTLSVKVVNPSSADTEGVMITISPEQLKKIAPDFNSEAFVIMDGSTEIPSQYNKHDQDYAGIVFVLDKLRKNESRKLTIQYNPKGKVVHQYPKRTQAELSYKVGGKFVDREYVGGEFKNANFLRVPPEHKDHSWFIRYEGPGWESDKVAYRFYLDWRDATDVFGKTTHNMVLQNVGLDGFDSYHELQPWGMDVMKVGKSLGLGTFGIFNEGHAIRVDKTDSVTSRIVENGTVYSSILTNYSGWQVGARKMDVQSRLTIHAGTRLTHQLINIKNGPEFFCTGLVKDTVTHLFQNKGDATHYGYIATYGKQSLNKDNLGLAVFFRAADFNNFTEDEFSHVVTIKNNSGKVDYFFMAAWQLEPEGITNEKQFVDYLNATAVELANPVKVELVK